jgi:hypothetical protein
MAVGPPVTVPPWRNPSSSSHRARAEPMSASVKGFPLGPRTRAPLARQRAASGTYANSWASRTLTQSCRGRGRPPARRSPGTVRRRLWPRFAGLRASSSSCRSRCRDCG